MAHSPPSTLVWKSQRSWGTGESFRTVLVNADGEVCALVRGSCLGPWALGPWTPGQCRSSCSQQELAQRTVKQSLVVAPEAENGEEEEEEGAEFGEEDLFHQQVEAGRGGLCSCPYPWGPGLLGPSHCLVAQEGEREVLVLSTAWRAP